MTKILAAIATLGPLGRLPASGTVGSLVAVGVGVMIIASVGIGWLAFALALAVLIGIPAANAYEQLTGEHDASPVIIDEVIGQWLTLLAIPYMYGEAGFWFWVILAFVLFRFFDISKFGPIGLAERLPKAYGVIADDVVAGLCAGAVILILSGVLLWI